MEKGEGKTRGQIIDEALREFNKNNTKETPKKKKKGKSITSEQISNVKDTLGDVSDQVAFLQQVFSDRPPDLEEHHFYGLCKILEHVHADSYKAWDLLDDLETQAVDK